MVTPIFSHVLKPGIRSIAAQKVAYNCLMLRIRNVDHVVLRVRDLEVMEAFYCDVLGCTVAKRNPVGVVHLRAGNALIDLVPYDSQLGRQGGAAPARHAPNMDHLCLRIEKAEPSQILAFLSSKGIDADEPAERFGADGDGLSVYLQDPEGNRLELRGFE